MQASLSIIKQLELPDFPSASSLEFYNKKLFVVGDDAKQILVLNENYAHIDSIKLFESTEQRIPKSDKADFESSAILLAKDEPKLVVFGSASLPQRQRAIQIGLNAGLDTIALINTKPLIERLFNSGIREVNIEGATTIGQLLILANRANNSNRINQLVILKTSALDNMEREQILTSTIDLTQQKNVIGISGLTYVAEKDILFFTASTEETSSAYDDGKIGDSYIGWFNTISSRLQESHIKPDGLINLSKTYKEFVEEKIESVCFEKVEGELYTIHLASDNDNGKSKLFKVQLQLD